MPARLQDGMAQRRTRSFPPSVQRIGRCAPEFAGQELHTWGPRQSKRTAPTAAGGREFERFLNRLKPAK
jgi:hypothetical protein